MRHDGHGARTLVTQDRLQAEARIHVAVVFMLSPDPEVRVPRREGGGLAVVDEVLSRLVDAWRKELGRRDRTDRSQEREPHRRDGEQQSAPAAGSRKDGGVALRKEDAESCQRARDYDDGA